MRDAFRIGAFVTVLVLATGAAARLSSAQAPTTVPALIKVRQMRLMAEEPMRERQEHREFLEHARELRRLARRLRASGKSSLRTPGVHARPEAGDEDSRGAEALSRSPRKGASPSAARLMTSLGTNVRCNNPAADGAYDGQCETAITRWNNYMVAAWNDGTGFTDGTYQTQGWATSTDGGATWVDQGKFPLPAGYASWVWASDPVLAVNPTTGAFYYAGLADATTSLSATGVIKGRFTGTSFAWGPASVVRTVPVTTDALDKEWLAVDPADGRAYLTYTHFTSAGNEIDFQWADSSLAAWSTYQRISLASESGWVQGSRPAVGPGGATYVVYYLIGATDSDFFRFARSANRGGSFSAPDTAVSFYSNWATGAPGFNRATGIQYPSIAVDRSGGAHDGRIYLAWNESLDWYDDIPALGAGTSKSEVEPNDVAAQATPTSVGQVLRGSLSSTSDLDYYKITLAAGQSLLAAVDSLSAAQTVTLRMFATDGATRLTYITAAAADVVLYGPAVFLYTAPAAGDYYLRVAAASGTGSYRVKTGPATRTTERGRDQRDVFTTCSDNAGVTWSTPARVNNDPVGYDDWLPEVAVTPTGQAACVWYDWRDASAWTSGGESSIYLATSSNGGVSWWEQGSVTNVGTAWTNVITNIIPNEGDYMSLFADAQGYAVAWSDGRNGNPDTYMAAVPLATTGVTSGESATFRLTAGMGLATASARLAFALPAASRTRLAIYDLQGRKVVTLADGPMGAGAQAIDWDLTDGAGQRVGAGLFWALLESGGRRASAHLVVLR